MGAYKKPRIETETVSLSDMFFMDMCARWFNIGWRIG